MSSLTIHLVDAYDPQFSLCPEDFNTDHVIFRRDLLEPSTPVSVAIGPQASDDTIRQSIAQLMEIVIHWRREETTHV